MKGSNDIDGYLYSLTMGTVENKEAFEQKINELLRDDWDFDRLSMLEQAILLIFFPGNLGKRYTESCCNQRSDYFG